ncbi:MAG: metal ABC transporter substrate-binding protein [Peptostreptococcaceae bacterium]
MFKKVIRILLIVTIGALLITGCNNKTNDIEVSSSNNEKLKIVTSFYPMYILTSNITKDIDNVEVSNLTKPTTGCLHDYSITTEEMKTLQDSDIFIINGAGIESFMDKVINQTPNLKIIEASKGIKLIEDEHDHKNSDGHEANPHVWLSITNAIQEVKNIEEKLIQYDPKNKDKYSKNANEYIQILEEQSEKMNSELKDLDDRNIITFHEAFPYFAKEFDLNIVGVVEREPGSQPSAKELQETIETIKKSNVKAIFVEPQYPSKTAEIIAKETGIKVYTLNPIVTGEMNETSYIDIMNKNLETLKEALK